MSVGSFINAGIGFLRSHTRVVAIWGVIYLVALIAFLVLSRPLFLSLANVQEQQAALRTAGAAAGPRFPAMGLIGSIFLVDLVGGLLGMVAFAAIVRAAADPVARDDRFAYLRVGMDELRLLGLVVLLIFISLAVEIGAVLLIIAIAAAFSAVIGSGASGVVTGILAVVAVCGAVYAEVRLSLAGVLTVIERRIVIKDAWRATKGQFWSLFLAYLVLGLIYLVISLIILAITSPATLSAYASLNPAVIQAASHTRLANDGGFSVMTIVQAVLGAIVSVPFAVIVIAGMTRTAQDLTGLGHAIARNFD